MGAPDKVDSVKNVSETSMKEANPAEDLERVAPNKEQFQTLMNNTRSSNPVQFDRMDKTPGGLEEVQKKEDNPILSDQSSSAQKNGSATDQDRKQRQSQTDAIEETSGTRSKKTISTSSGSLMDEVTRLNKNVAQISQMDPDAVKTQAKELIGQLEQAKTKLEQSKAEIKPSYQSLMRNRLSHIDDNLKIALNKAGVEYTPAPVSTESSNPVKRFINTLTNSQQQLENLGSTLNTLTSSPKQISPAHMLAIQLKMNQIQQQIELFSNLLNKALESAKTIMNVQV